MRVGKGHLPVLLSSGYRHDAEKRKRFACACVGKAVAGPGEPLVTGATCPWCHCSTPDGIKSQAVINGTRSSGRGRTVPLGGQASAKHGL